MIYKNRLIELPPHSSYFLWGVRGCGKTLLLRKRFPKALYINLLDKALYHNYLSDMSSFYRQVSNFKEHPSIESINRHITSKQRAIIDQWIIVDEIQKMPDLLNEVHRLIEDQVLRLIDEKNPSFTARRFILTGSSVRRLRTERNVNLLAGRAGVIYLHPFVPAELGGDFDLNRALRYGLLPVIWSSTDPELSLKGYVQQYLSEEIKSEAIVKDLPGFVRFLETAGVYHGKLINMNTIAKDSQIKRNIVQDFFSILEDTMLGFFLPSYQTNLRKREKKHKKFYFIDPGLARAVKNNFGPVSVEEKGTLLEGLVAQILRAYKDYYSLYDDMFYWSPAEANKTEVDFLLKKGNKFVAIEVKAKKQVFSNDYKGLKAIKDLKGITKRIVVYLGNHVDRTQDGIDIWSFDFFCKALHEKHIF